MSRNKLAYGIPFTDVVITMAEGNIGAMSVLADMADKDPFDVMYWIAALDDMNIRGSQIWVGYKDHCNQNLGLFIENILARDANMVATINEIICQDPNAEIAVVSGASLNR